MGCLNGSSQMGTAVVGSHTFQFFLWGYINSKVHATEPSNLSEIEERICTTCREVGEEMLRNVVETALKSE